MARAKRCRKQHQHHVHGRMQLHWILVAPDAGNRPDRFDMRDEQKHVRKKIQNKLSPDLGNIRTRKGQDKIVGGRNHRHLEDVEHVRHVRIEMPRTDIAYHRMKNQLGRGKSLARQQLISLALEYSTGLFF